MIFLGVYLFIAGLPWMKACSLAVILVRPDSPDMVRLKVALNPGAVTLAMVRYTLLLLFTLVAQCSPETRGWVLHCLLTKLPFCHLSSLLACFGSCSSWLHIVLLLAALDKGVFTSW